MAVKATTIFVFFDIALFSLFTAKTLATFTDPNSISPCRNLVPDNNNNVSKFYAQYKATYGEAAATEFAKAVDATSRAKKLVATAKDKSSSVVDVLTVTQSVILPHYPCVLSWRHATGAFNETLSFMQGKIALSEKELNVVQRYLVVAAESQNQSCSLGKSPKPKDAEIREAKRACVNAFNACKNILGYKPAPAR